MGRLQVTSHNSLVRCHIIATPRSATVGCIKFESSVVIPLSLLYSSAVAVTSQLSGKHAGPLETGLDRGAQTE